MGCFFCLPYPSTRSRWEKKLHRAKSALQGHALWESTAFLGNQSRVCGMLPAACRNSSPQHGVINPHGATSSLPGHPLCLREKRGGAGGKSLKERDTSVTAERRKPGCLGNMRGRLGQGKGLHSEEEVWAESMPVLSPCPKETAAPWPPVRGGARGLPPGDYSELEKQLPERPGHHRPRTWSPGKQGPTGTSSPAALLP